ncbi:MAG: pseudouridine synthase [Xanthomonadales bacterium]|nr:pseudouridine synthase [Xanthomonadales bacterium]
MPARQPVVSSATSTPSRLQLPPGPWATVFDALCARFPAIDRETWHSRFARGRVLDADGTPLTERTPFRTGAEIRYYREVDSEPCLAVQETILHVDEHLIVVDKPHFLPVTPGGIYVNETLLARLLKRFGEDDIVPLHRLDRLTAGVMLFSRDPKTRSRYQSLFRDRAIHKRYEALALPLPMATWPLERRSRLVRGEPFFRTQEIDGVPNACTRIDVIERGPEAWRYALEPVTGRKHQLRVHMAALGAPIRNDPLYPQLADQTPDDPECPLKLLARSLAFIDPLDGSARYFESRLQL